MSFIEEYQKAREKLSAVRAKLLGDVLEAPARDADNMKSYYDRYKDFQETIPLILRSTTTGQEKLIYLGRKLSDLPSRLKTFYSGPTKPYVDTGQVPPKQFDLPSVPVIVWEVRPPDFISVEMMTDQLKSNLMLYSDTLIEDVPADFQNAYYYYYYPREAYQIVEERRYEIPAEQRVKVMRGYGAIEPMEIVGTPTDAFWTQIPGVPVLTIYSNARLRCKAYALPQWGDAAWVEQTKEVDFLDYWIIVANAPIRLNFIFFGYRFTCENITIDGVVHFPAFIISKEGGTLGNITFIGYSRSV